MQQNAQAAGNVLLVRPMHFGFNAETAASNRFQSQTIVAADVVHGRALAEHDGLVGTLRAAGVGTHVCDDTAAPPKPDAIFPNNWVSLHGDGTVILYPMEAPNRRAERRRELIERLRDDGGFRVSRILDLSPLERRGHFLEGTGSLVIDHVNGVAYAALSSRTHPAAVAEFAGQTGLETVTFRTTDAQGIPLYHTNVMLSIGSRFAVICASAIAESGERRAVLERLSRTGREIVEIDAAQMKGFAANILELQAHGGSAVILMSGTARQALRPEQLSILAALATVVAVPVATIEQAGGGSVRCMLAENFLPPVA